MSYARSPLLVCSTTMGTSIGSLLYYRQCAPRHGRDIERRRRVQSCSAETACREPPGSPTSPLLACWGVSRRFQPGAPIHNTSDSLPPGNPAGYAAPVPELPARSFTPAKNYYPALPYSISKVLSFLIRARIRSTEPFSSSRLRTTSTVC